MSWRPWHSIASTAPGGAAISKATRKPCSKNPWNAISLPSADLRRECLAAVLLPRPGDIVCNQRHQCDAGSADHNLQGNRIGTHDHHHVSGKGEKHAGTEASEPFIAASDD